MTDATLHDIAREQDNKAWCLLGTQQISRLLAWERSNWTSGSRSSGNMAQMEHALNTCLSSVIAVKPHAIEPHD